MTSTMLGIPTFAPYTRRPARGRCVLGELSAQPQPKATSRRTGVDRNNRYNMLEYTPPVHNSLHFTAERLKFVNRSSVRVRVSQLNFEEDCNARPCCRSEMLCNCAHIAKHKRTVEIQDLSKKELNYVIQTLCDGNPDLKYKINEYCLQSNVHSLKKQLQTHFCNVMKSVPNERLESKHDYFSYRKAEKCIVAFKKSCVCEGFKLLDEENWRSAIEYCLIAWKYVQRLPEWENDFQNSDRRICFEKLAQITLVSIKNSNLMKSEYERIMERISQANDINNSMFHCLEEIKSKLV